ncbi:unnamed protein product [Bursaphelenchus okinawaensis]|uniref:glucuronosyltransferase n=1 Tax=Bursaphelenchus okinawaensis TaxID=465554 RepID=A0A811K3A6_9BILA|nr:unnamed protein product [Bursaphelenchus okinawaensis]CAG9090471.1 unnamed protein product [Bursaphelenchus okinawaensis]
MGKIANEIAGAGHEVVVVQPIIAKNVSFSVHKNTKVRLIEVMVKASMDELASIMKNTWIEDNFKQIGVMGQIFHDACVELYNNKDVINELKGEHFDLGISGWFDICGVGLFKYIGLQKYITAYGTSVPPPFMSHMGVPPSVSFVPGVFGGVEDRSFFARAKDQFGYVFEERLFYPKFWGKIAEAYKVFDDNLDYKVCFGGDF